MKKIKQRLSRIKFRIKYAFSSMVVRFTGLGSERKKFLKTLKDKYKGKRCFIIGNGPSLTISDLESLKDEVTFASNRVFKVFSETDWRPTYYGIFDESVGSGEDVPENVNKLKCEGKFFREQGWLTYRPIKDACYINTWHSRKYLNKPDFSEDITKGVFTIATVTYTMMQIARYMGFSEIYLIGVDHKYAIEQKRDGSVVNTGVKSYFGKESVVEKQIVASTWEMEEVYKFAEEYSRKNNFRIFNATRGGYLEVFERVSLDEVLKNKGEKI